MYNIVRIACLRCTYCNLFFKNFLQAKCEHYKKKRMEQQETIAALQKDIYRLTQEEEERIITQNRVFSYLCKRVPHTVLDKQ